MSINLEFSSVCGVNFNEVLFLRIVTVVIDAYVPLKKIRSAVKYCIKCPILIILNVLFVKKAALWRRYRVDKSLENKNQYSNQAAHCKKLVLDFEKAKEIRVVNKANIGSFYRYVNRCLSGRTFEISHRRFDNR